MVIDAQHWHVKVSGENENNFGDELPLNEEILQLFEIVQQILHVFRQQLINNKQIVNAFKGK